MCVRSIKLKSSKHTTYVPELSGNCSGFINKAMIIDLFGLSVKADNTEEKGVIA